MDRGSFKRACLAIALALTLSAWADAARAEYPDHTITAVVPFDTGGASDILARILAANMSRELGQPVVVANKAGAGGNLGINFVAHSKPDGYTLLFTAPAATQNPAMFRNMPYDPLKDIMPIALDGQSLFIVAVNAAKVPATTLPEFVDLVRKNPGKYNAAAGGLVSRLSVEFFRVKNNLSVVIAPYNSAGEAGTAVLSGEADFAILDPPPIAAGLQAGKIRGLAVTGTRRITAYPDIPTAAEAGLPGYEDYTYHGLYAPGGLAPDIAARLHAAVNKITQQPDVIEQYQKLGWVPLQKSQAEFDAFYRAELVKWKNVVSEAKIPPVD